MILTEVGESRVQGYLYLALLTIAVLKPLFPHNVGLWREGPFGLPTSLGAKFPAPMEPAGGYWVILIGLIFGLAFLVFTHRGARRFLAWVRQRRETRAIA